MKMQSYFVLDNIIKDISINCNVEIFDYEREGNKILITSGYGIGIGLMDVLKNCRYFLDVDNYKNVDIPWKSIGVMLSLGKPSQIIMAGWFLISNSIIFNQIKEGIESVPYKILYDIYINGKNDSLENLIKRCNSH